MNSRPVEVTISASHIMAKMEELFRSQLFRKINDNEVMEDFTFGEIIGDCIKIKFNAVREEV